MKENIFKFFLEQRTDIPKNKEEFNYSFNLDNTIDEFNNEFNKFIEMLDCFFYDGEKLVSSINSLYISLKDEVLEHIVNLYLYAIKNELIYEKYIIVEFLITYYNSLIIYKKEDTLFKNKSDEFKKNLSCKVSKNFYNEFNEICKEFYFELVDYCLKNDIHIYQHIFKRIYNNLKKDKDVLIDELINEDFYLIFLIDYDKKIDKHYNQYIDYVFEILKQEFEFQWINKIIIKISKQKLLSDKDTKKIVNICVDKTNDFCVKNSKKDENSLTIISQLEATRKFLISLNESSLKEVYTKKIKECIVNLLSLKRFLLKDEEYLNKGTRELSYNLKLEQKKCDDFVKSLLDNNYKLYSASSIDFDSEMFNCIELYSKYPLSHLGSRYKIDTKNQIYLTNDDFNSSSKKETNFKKYYENIGKKYVEDHRDKLLNIFGDNFYYELLKSLEEKFMMNQNISLSILGDKNFYSIINNLNNTMLHSYSNYNSIIVANILAIEININKCLTKIGQSYTPEAEDNLDKLFEFYVSNNIARNGIMYLYYSLYERTGPNLRNRAMHGSLFNDDLKIPLLISFSGLIFTNWLLVNG